MNFRHLFAAFFLLLAFGATTAHAQDPAGLVRKPAKESKPPAMGFTVAMNMGADMQPGAPRVTGVVPGSNAERAGLKEGDVLIAVNGRDMKQIPWFPDRTGGTKYTLRVLRGGEERELTFVYPATPAR